MFDFGNVTSSLMVSAKRAWSKFARSRFEKAGRCGGPSGKSRGRAKIIWRSIAASCPKMTEVPLVIIRTGRKKEIIANDPWTYQLCHVALEYYRALARQNEIENMSGWPMLAGQGISKPSGEDEIAIGPHTVLYAPPTLDTSGNSKMGNLGTGRCARRADRQGAGACPRGIQQARSGANKYPSRASPRPLQELITRARIPQSESRAGR